MDNNTAMDLLIDHEQQNQNEEGQVPVQSSFGKSLLQGKRSMWAVAIVSLIGVATLAQGSFNDHKRIVALQEKINERQMIQRQNLVMQGNLSLAAAKPDTTTSNISSWKQSSSTSTVTTETTTSQMTCGEPHIIEHSHTITAEEQARIEADNETMSAFSIALTQTLNRIKGRLAIHKENYAVFYDPITNYECDQIAEIETNINQLKYDLYSMQKKDEDLIDMVDALKASVDKTEDNYSAHAEGTVLSIEERVRLVEQSQTEIATNVTNLSETTTTIQDNMVTSQTTATDLTKRVEDAQAIYDALLDSSQADTGEATKIVENITQINTTTETNTSNITTEENNYTTIATEVTVLEEDIDVMIGAYGTRDDETDRLEARVTVLEADTTDLNKDMDLDKKAHKKFKGRVSYLEDHHKNDQVRNKVIQEKSDEIETSVDDKQDQFSALNEKFMGHNGDTLNDRLTEIEKNNDNCHEYADGTDVGASDCGSGVTKVNDDVTEHVAHLTNELDLKYASETLSQCGGGCIDCEIVITKCTECRKGAYTKFPDFDVYQCVDEAYYVYGNKCDRNDPDVDTSKCSTDTSEYCHESHRWNDEQYFDGPTSACRTVAEYNIKFQYDEGEACPADQGLCVYGCDNGSSCVETWPHNDPMANDSPYVMCRCSEISDSYNPFAY